MSCRTWFGISQNEPSETLKRVQGDKKGEIQNAIWTRTKKDRIFFILTSDFWINWVDSIYEDEEKTSSAALPYLYFGAGGSHRFRR